MAVDIFTNNATTTVTSGGGTTPASGSSETWTVASASGFPSASNTASPPTQFRIIDPAATSEVMLVTNVSGTSWTVTRGAESTTPVAHVTGFTIRHTVTAGWLTGAQSKLTSGFYNVLDFGAVNDGATDNTTAFQAALTAAEASSGTTASSTVYFPPGFWKTQPLTVGHRTTLQGAGPGVTTLQLVNNTGGVVGTNIVDANTSSMETSAAGWTAGSNTTLSQSTTEAKTGTHSLKFVSTASGAVSATTASAYTVSGGWTQQVQTYVYTANTSRTATMTVTFLDGSSTQRSSITSGAFTLTQNVFTALTMNVVIPGWCSTVKVTVTPVSTGASEAFYMDVFTISPCSSWMISNAEFATMISVRDMRLDGNVSNQNALSWTGGICFNGSGSNGSGAGNLEYTDIRCQVNNVVIQYFTGDGLTTISRGTSQLDNVQSWANQGCGFNLNIDNEVTNCDAGQSGLDGFFVNGCSQLANCKAWYSGYIGATAAAITTGATTGTTGYGMGSGFHFSGVTSGVTAVACVAQDNSRNGFYIDNSERINLSACNADTNNNNVNGYTFSNIDINNSYNSVLSAMLSFARGANSQAPATALYCYAGSNLIEVTMATQGFTATTKLNSSSASYGNVYIIDASATGSQNVSYASTITPDVSNGSFIDVGALTGPITVANPSINANVGSNLTFKFAQDSTGGRVVTWGANYTTSWQPNPLASSISTISFAWDSQTGGWLPIGYAEPNSAGEKFESRGTNVMTAMLTSPTTTASATAVSITGLSIANVPAGSYLFELQVLMKESSATSAIPGFGITGPATTTISAMATWYTLAGTSAALYVSSTAITTVSARTATTELPFELEGMITITAAGTIQAQYQTSADTLTADAGSFLRLTPIAP